MTEDANGRIDLTQMPDDERKRFIAEISERRNEHGCRMICNACIPGRDCKSGKGGCVCP